MALAQSSYQNLHYLSIAAYQIIPQCSGLKQHLISHSFCRSGIWAWLSLVFCVRFSQGLQSRCQLGLRSFQCLMEKGHTAVLAHLIIGVIHFLLGCWREERLGSLLAVGRSSLFASTWSPLNVSSQHGNWFYHSKQVRGAPLWSHFPTRPLISEPTMLIMTPHVLALVFKISKGLLR